MKKSFIFLMLVFLSFDFSYLYSSNYSVVIEEPQTRRRAEGNIDHVEIVAKPAGSYVEYDIIMVFDAFDGNLANVDSTEIQFSFSTPQKSFIDDSWLWMGDTIIIAALIDKWTATLIYENIVKRRKDPSLLIDNGGNQYSLNIYPLSANGTRKVKIKVNVPAAIDNNELIAQLPMDFYLLKNIIRNDIDIAIYENDDFGEPELTNLDLSMTSVGFRHSTSFDPKILENNQNYNLKFKIKNEKDYIFTTQNKGGETFYQFISSFDFSNSELFKPRKMAILIDFDRTKSSFQKSNIINDLKNSMLDNMNQNDYFNVFLPGFEVSSVSDNWIKATEENIINVFDNIVPSQMSDYTDLPALFNSAIEFTNKNDNEDNTPIPTAFLVISNTDEVGDNEIANELILHIQEKLNMSVEVYTASFATNFRTYKIGGLNYSANDYFNWNITKQTGGNSEKIQDNNNSLLLMFKKQINYIFNSLENFSFITYTKDGFTHSKFTSTDLDYFNRATVMSEVGKMEMGLPFIAQINGYFRGELFSKRFEIDSDDAQEEIYPISKMWTSKKIQEYYSLGKLDNKKIHEIIDLSMNNRVLSIYTAFLALEPSSQDTIINNDPSEGDGDPVSVEEITISKEISFANAHPNPFSTNIQIDINKSLDLNLISEIKIVDLKGTIVKIFKLDYILANRGVINWDGYDETGNELPTGIYFLTIKVNNELKTIKLIKR